MYNKALWETSGHWQNYQADMYAVHEMQPEGTPAASLTTDSAWTKAVTEPQVTACSLCVMSAANAILAGWTQANELPCSLRDLRLVTQVAGTRYLCAPSDNCTAQVLQEPPSAVCRFRSAA